LGIAALMIAEQKYRFANGRSVPNALDRLRMGHAIRGDEALALGAVWEGDELVTYDFSTLALKAGSDEDDFLNDND
jgi:hypothetical protein